MIRKPSRMLWRCKSCGAGQFQFAASPADAKEPEGHCPNCLMEEGYIRWTQKYRAAEANLLSGGVFSTVYRVGKTDAIHREAVWAWLGKWGMQPTPEPERPITIFGSARARTRRESTETSDPAASP